MSESATEEKPSFHLRARLRVRVAPVVRGIDDDDFYYSIGNYMMITMGGRMEQFECVVPEVNSIVFQPVRSAHQDWDIPYPTTGFTLVP
jgi:hypothetical protein